MALKNLTENEMVEVSSAWLDAERAGGALDGYPLLAALRPSIEAAHEGLLAGGAAPDDAAREKERKGLYEQGVALDQRFDRKGRGAFNLLGALADLTDDPARSERLLALQHALFPDGHMGVLGASWKGEAGHARRVRKNVLGDKETVGALKAIATSDKHTLLDGVRDFAGAGEALGKVEDKRVALGDGSGEEEDTRPTRAKARNRWIAVGNTMVNIVDGLLGLEGEARKRLLGGLSDAEKKADARALARRPAEAAADEPAEPVEGAPKG